MLLLQFIYGGRYEKDYTGNNMFSVNIERGVCEHAYSASRRGRGGRYDADSRGA